MPAVLTWSGLRSSRWCSGEALIASLADIERIIVWSIADQHAYPGAQSRRCSIRADGAPGFATQDGQGEIVVVVAMMLVGEELPG